MTAGLIPAVPLEATGLVRAAFSTRHGGVSAGAYHSLNLGYTVGDLPEAVTANRARVAEALGITSGTLAEAEQVHGSLVAAVGRSGDGRPGGAPIRGADALITADPGVWLAVYAADCVPVLILDERTPAIAAVHAGWRGTAAAIVPRVFGRMREAFGTTPADCTVVLGPAIGGCCYEVDAPVGRAMAGAPWWGAAARPTGPDRWRLDLKTAIRFQVLACGVPDARAITMAFCTACRPDLFFSHRRDGVTGRMAACLSLLSDR
ncbi:MAG TPA: peptidoglycan editing factor PgeF [bacterium]|nr:peptidoglycan editing factor PgeF [bacterium]